MHMRATNCPNSLVTRDRLQTTDTLAERPPEADLGMFSMFSRTEAPQKGGPHKSTFFSFFATEILK